MKTTSLLTILFSISLCACHTTRSTHTADKAINLGHINDAARYSDTISGRLMADHSKEVLLQEYIRSIKEYEK